MEGESAVELNYRNRLPQLLLDFLTFGLFTFGGGWSIIAQMQRLYVQKRHELTEADMLDLASVGRSLPGTMIGNVAMMFGYRAAGLPGGFICVFGMALPPMAVLTVITYFYTAFQANPWVNAAMTGIRAAVVPIVLSTLLGMLKSAFTVPPCVVVAGICAVLFFCFNVSCVWLVVLGAVFGILISGYYERRNESGEQKK